MVRDLRWQNYVQDVEALCEGHALTAFDHEAHVASLEALSARLDLADPSLVDAFERLARGQEEPYLTHTVRHTSRCRIILVSLVAEGYVGLHEHPDQGGFILCCRGQVNVDAFDLLPGASVRLRRAYAVEARAGDTTSLTPERANVHRLFCPEPTWLVDVFTPPLSEAGRASCRAFGLDDEVAPGIFNARITPTRE